MNAKILLVLAWACGVVGVCAADFDVKKFGAVGDGAALDTAAIQKALDACAKAGGGRVTVPAGTFLTGTIYLGDDTELHLAEGAVLKGSGNLADYNAPDAYAQNYGSKAEGWSAKHLVLALEKKNVAITGPGVIDGNSSAFFAFSPSFYAELAWRDGAINASDYAHQGRPGQEVVFVECRHVRVENVTLRNMCCWSCFIWGCDDVLVRNVKVRNNPLHVNTDGVDVDSCRNVLVTGCDVVTGDDAFAVRGSSHRLKDKSRICENVVISNCTASSQACAVRVGVGRGAIRNLRVVDLDVRKAGTALELHSTYGDHEKGVQIEDVEFRDVKIRNAASAMNAHAGGPRVKAALRNVRFVCVDAEAEGPQPVYVAGNGLSDYDGFLFKDCRLAVVPPTGRLAGREPPPKREAAVTVKNAKNAVFDGFRLDWRPGTSKRWKRAFAVLDAPGLRKNDVRLPEPTISAETTRYAEKGICGHGGDLAGPAPENSIEGALLAIAQGAAMVEFDVQQCKSGEFIVMHDGDLSHTTTVTGNTWQSTLAHVKSGTFRSDRYPKYGHVKVPTFDEFVDAMPRDGTLFNVHCYGSRHIARDVALKLKEKGRLEQMYVAAALPLVREARKAVPDLKICNMTRPGPGNRPWTDAENWEYLRATIEGGCQYIQLRQRWSPKFSAWAHMAGVKVNYCPVNAEGADPSKLEDILAMGVDYVFCENLAAVLPKWRELQAKRKSEIAFGANGEPFTVVLPAQATASLTNAAEHVRDYAKRALGVEVKIVDDTESLPSRAIVLGYTKYTDALVGRAVDRAALGTDGFRIVNCAPHLVIAGSEVRGALYGAYELLETFLGVGWYASWRTHVPKRTEIRVPAGYDDVQVPFFELREPSWMDYRMHPDLCSHLRQNGNLDGYCGEGESIPPQAKHGGPAAPFVKIGRNPAFAHTFYRLLPPEKYFKDHPEYFSEVNGIRRDRDAQLCLTHPDVLRIVTANALEALRKDPRGKILSISQNDYYNYCTCPRCKAADAEDGSPIGSLLKFVNAVAEEVEKVRPDVYVETFAYEYSRTPPKKTKPRKNVIIRLCSIECDFARTFAEKAHPENVKFLSDLDGWKKLTENLYLWDYTTDFAHHLYPFPVLEAIPANMRLFRLSNVRFSFEESGGYYDDLASLKGWLIGKLMWNPFQDEKALIRRFAEGFYGRIDPDCHGSGADAACEYVRLLGELERRSAKKHYFSCFTHDVPGVYTDEFLAWAHASWTNAMRRAEATGDSTAAYNFRMADAATTATRLDRWAANVRYVWASRDPGRFAIPEEAKARYADMMRYMDEAKKLGREIHFGENREQVLKSWRRIVDFKAPAAGSDKAEVGTGEWQYIGTGRSEIVDDPTGLNGKVVKIGNHQDGAVLWLKFSHVAADDGVKYRFRLRVKPDRVKGGKGEAFYVEFGDCVHSAKVEDLKDDWQWIELGTTTIPPAGLFEFFPGRFAKGGGRGSLNAFYVDRLEITRANGS